VTAARPAENPHANAPPRRLGAIPQGSEGRPASANPEPTEPRRLAAIPPASAAPRKPTDPPAVTVLRGGPARYAQTGRPQAAQSAITVIRGASGIVRPPGPLILRVPD
jgi:hypothetical protein